MDLHIIQTNQQADIGLSGSFTFDDNVAFKQVIALTHNEDIRVISLNFAQVTFVDSAALGMLMVLRNAAEEKQQRVVLSGARGQVEKIFRLSRFDGLFSLVS